MVENLACIRLDSIKGKLDSYFVPYLCLMRQLHGESFMCGVETLCRLRGSTKSETLLFAVVRQEVVGTAQASLSYVLPKPKIHIENVVIDEAWRGKGIGRILITELIRVSEGKWNYLKRGGFLRVELTNSPRKGNAEFYKRLGFRPRTEDAGDPTVVWVLD